MLSPSKIFLSGGLAFLGGLTLALVWPGCLWLFTGLVVILPLLLIIWWSKSKPRFLIILGLCFCLGFARVSLMPKTVSNLTAFFDQKEAVIEGVVAAEPDERGDQTKLTVAVSSVNGQSQSGQILLTLLPYPRYAYGDVLSLKGTLQLPPKFTDFDYRQYLADQGITALMYRPQVTVVSRGSGNVFLGALCSFKNIFREGLRKIFPEPQAALASGMLLGAKREMSEAWTERFNQTGLTHLLVVSGGHLSIIAAALMGIFKGRLGRWSLMAVIIGVLTIFILLTGIAASALRSGVMAGLFLLALPLGRLPNMRNAIFIAALAMLAIAPRLLIADLGFQLSFLATLGIIYFAPALEKLFKFIPPSGGIRSALVMSLAAQVLVLPLIVYRFGRLSLVSPLANLLVLPLVPGIMLTSSLAGLASLASTSLGQLVAAPAWLFLTMMVKIVEWLTRWPLASINLQNFSPWWLAVYYGFWVIFLAIKTRRRVTANQV